MALAEIEAQTRESTRQAAAKCGAALLAYVRANPSLLYAEQLPALEADELRRCLTDYVATLRALGTTPERTVVAVKELVRGAAGGTPLQLRALTDAAVKWAIRAYYQNASGGR